SPPCPRQQGRGGDGLRRGGGAVAGADPDAGVVLRDEAELLLDAGGDASHDPRRGQGAGGRGEDGELGLSGPADGVGGAPGAADRGGHLVVGGAGGRWLGGLEHGAGEGEAVAGGRKSTRMQSSPEWTTY